jgi:predicted DCC family thiol-disulfide oxidoreductase YuxK
VKQPKEWLRKVAPALKLSLHVLKVACLTSSILPLDNVAGMSPSELLQKIDLSLESEVTHMTEEESMDFGTVEAAMQFVQCDAEAISTAERRRIAAYARMLPSVTVRAYDAMATLLWQLEQEQDDSSTPSPEWRPIHTGLQLCSSTDGSSAWVSPEMSDSFREHGVSSFRAPVTAEST